MSEVVAAVAVLLLVASGVYLHKLRGQLAEARRELKLASDRIDELGMRDELTGAFNRRYLLDSLARERARVARTGTPFSICLFDIDNFKGINDARGPAAGDGVLKRLVELMPVELRSIDVFGRFTGGSFMLILPGTDGAGAAACAERLRRRLESNTFAELGGRRATVTEGVSTQGEEEEPPSRGTRS